MLAERVHVFSWTYGSAMKMATAIPEKATENSMEWHAAISKRLIGLEISCMLDTSSVLIKKTPCKGSCRNRSRSGSVQPPSRHLAWQRDSGGKKLDDRNVQEQRTLEENETNSFKKNLLELPSRCLV